MSRRRALITGASSGIGAATALTLADAGYDLWLTYATDSTAVSRVAAECRRLGADCRTSVLDLRTVPNINALAAEVGQEWDYLEVVVNNGGVCPYQSFDDIDVDDWDLVLETNARGTFLLTRALLPWLRAAPDGSDRSIVNLSSVAGQIGGMTTSIHYAASKGALLAITRTFARLLSNERIRVNAVCPGPVDSTITGHLPADSRAALTEGVPLGRFGHPDEVAWIIHTLCSPKSSFVTGATYDVNGGVRID